MLEIIKQYIDELPSITFDDLYQKYIFSVQDINVSKEISELETDDIISLSRLISRLHKELLS